ncbi:Uncharacterised protein [Amycolatopsis camponoti]|uniref:Uncharacterized protein n=1 Tax=Amycolatopsis camponoti TaxID=2606593 RepID=A0A6I8LXE1_9PSEU|nr:Uncharacterised protein [Amycolatopsis camponoti]
MPGTCSRAARSTAVTGRTRPVLLRAVTLGSSGGSPVMAGSTPCWLPG